MTDQVEGCLVPFRGQDIEYVRKARGAPAMPYVRHAAVTRRLIEVFGLDWSFEIVESHLDDQGAIVRVRLTCAGHHREQWGGASARSKMDSEDLLKSATSKAIRKAAALFGVGLHLWEQAPPRDDRGRDKAEQRPLRERKIGVRSGAKAIGQERAKNLELALRPYGWRPTAIANLCRSRFGKKPMELTEKEGKDIYEYAQKLIGGMDLSRLSESTISFLEKVFDDFGYRPDVVESIYNDASGNVLADLTPVGHRALLGRIQIHKEMRRKAEEGEEGNTRGT